MAEYWNPYNMMTDKVRPNIPVTPTESAGVKDESVAHLQQMTSGETLQGEVLHVKGNEVLIRLSDQTVVSAQLAKDMQVSVGQILLFELQNGSEGQVMLRALFTNLAQGEVLGKAISDAGLPLNKQTAQMVEALMKEELPISRENLQNVYREVVTFTELEPSEIAKMHKLGIEVNEANVKQFAAFIHCEERVASATEHLISALQEEVSMLQAGGESDQAFRLGREIMDIIIRSTEAEFGTDFLQNGNMQLSKDAPVIQVMKEVFAESVSQQHIESGVSLHQNLNVSEPAMPGGSDALGVLNEMIAKENPQVASVLSGEENVSVSPKELLQSFVRALEQNLIPKESLAKLFDKAEFRELIQHELSERFLMKPSEVEDVKNVSDFYAKLRSHVSQLAAGVAETVLSSQSLAQSVQQMKDNVDFLYQLNQMIPYVQLPLKMNGQSATGDLYVYADKKSLAEKQDEITAVLHLDMKHLGHLDVYVKLHESKVETDFKVESDQILLFLSDHIEVLNERLDKRGYQLKANLSRMEEAKTIHDDIMKVVDNPNASLKDLEPVSYYRLDIRA